MTLAERPRNMGPALGGESTPPGAFGGYTARWAASYLQNMSSRISLLIPGIAALLLVASSAQADLPPRNAPECEGRSAGAECTSSVDGKKGVCAFGAPDRAGRSALLCKVGGAAPASSAAPASPSAAPSASALPAKGSGCSVGGGAPDTMPSSLLALAALFIAWRAARRRP